ncbi:bifunctional oligoribonuclease/PAP phosphatase NrnA [Facklamia sp. DSM 111018]|uniref:Bifunctional oligoribonuclease/PAP phosphatase NrnA n=1 Tax=Facklamia lactis TaxID=2749967 RepID=A0ABS0LNY0_9LACT|nr:bifunctional oligoribonuclease/PAP phosphatase NrnA [Facklamia lactis]MBG9985878.1 bifunctional oligoribonuclease/PAP phosphatase NrnA [Facklamia lactis]
MIINIEKINEFYQLIKAYDTIIIHRHVRPDPDAVGSQLGLKAWIQNTYPDKTVLAAGTIGESLAWLGKMDEVTRDDYQDALVIVVDTADQPRIDGKNYKQGKSLIKIDHHLLVDSYGDLEIVDENASSTAELLTQMAIHLSEVLPINKEVADLFYAGIVGDTGRFQFSNTTDQTFLSVGYLMKNGLDNVTINNYFNELEIEELRFQSLAISRIRQHEHGVASLIIYQKDLIDYEISEEATNSITNIPGRIKGVISWVVFIQQASESEKFRARIRSKGPNINPVAIAFDGGGHAMASGANATDKQSRDRLIEALIEVNQQYLEEL